MHLETNMGSQQLQCSRCGCHHGQTATVTATDYEDVPIYWTGGNTQSGGKTGILIIHIPVGKHYDPPTCHDPCRTTITPGPYACIPLIYPIEYFLGSPTHQNPLGVFSDDISACIHLECTHPQRLQEHLPFGSDPYACLPYGDQPHVLQNRYQSADAPFSDSEMVSDRDPAEPAASTKKIEGIENIGIRESACGTIFLLIQ